MRVSLGTPGNHTLWAPGFYLRTSPLGELYDPDPGHYGPAQRWAVIQRAAGFDGVVYDSVRDAGGECVAIFWPRLVAACRVGERLAYESDGEKIAAVYG